MILVPKAWLLVCSSLIALLLVAACGSEEKLRPEVTYQPSLGGEIVTEEPLGVVFTYEPDDTSSVEPSDSGQ